MSKKMSGESLFKLIRKNVFRTKTREDSLAYFYQTLIYFKKSEHVKCKDLNSNTILIGMI